MVKTAEMARLRHIPLLMGQPSLAEGEHRDNRSGISRRTPPIADSVGGYSRRGVP